MWAQMLSAPGRFETVEVPAPGAADLAPGQVLLATRAGAICGSDLPNFKGAPFPHPKNQGRWVTSAPGFPMHEVVGEVIASKHSDHDKGDLVVGWASGFDALAEVIISDGEGLAGYDTDIAPSTAVMLQPLACVLYAVDQLDDVTGKTVAVIGQGPIGLLFSHVLKSRGARHVIGVDRVDRTDAGSIFGVDEVVTASANLWAGSLDARDRPQVVVEAVGHQVTTMKNCLDAVAFGGEIYYFGIPDDQVYPFEMMSLLRKNLTLRSGATIERRRVLEEASRYLAKHPELRDVYVSDVFLASDVEAAFIAAIAPRKGQFKISIDMA
ncbi:zinc-binding dehydrogenase [Nocardia bovistercoris]|uniref:Zinc-binding dehydrogenase n=1 Tax=Nocardia bovistercoris TaxID=2785916 RepID=A0A931IHG8_9NOCA|nr:zinc-binding dehydrogenase [Nocardia bovistercoris]MBH0779800.1 zinc-binding dehydrogenase [Nocardia bovistercoris]